MDLKVAMSGQWVALPLIRIGWWHRWVCPVACVTICDSISVWLALQDWRDWHTTFFNEYKHTEKSLRQLLLVSVEGMYVRSLRHRYAGYSQTSTKQLLAHMYTTSVNIYPDNLKANDKKLHAPYNANHPVENRFYQVENVVKYLAAGNMPHLMGRRWVAFPYIKFCCWLGGVCPVTCVTICDSSTAWIAVQYCLDWHWIRIYRIKKAIEEAVMLIYHLRSIGVKIKNPSSIFVDNMSMLLNSYNPGSSLHEKVVALIYHFELEHAANDVVEVCKVDT